MTDEAKIEQLRALDEQIEALDTLIRHQEPVPWEDATALVQGMQKQRDELQAKRRTISLEHQLGEIAIEATGTDWATSRLSAEYGLPPAEGVRLVGQRLRQSLEDALWFGPETRAEWTTRLRKLEDFAREVFEVLELDDGYTFDDAMTRLRNVIEGDR